MPAEVSTPLPLAPVARREPTSTTLHGVTLQDDYRWLREKASPEVLAYLEAENAYTAAQMAGTEDLQSSLYTEMLSHIKETDESLPYRMNGWFYSTRTVEGLQYPIHCRREAIDGRLDLAQPEQLLLDINLLAEGKPFMAVGTLAVSPDTGLLAYTTDDTGFRQYTLHLRNLTSGADLPDTAERVGSVAWAADSATFFFTTEDATTKRHNQLWRHTLGDAGHTLILEEEDERFNLGIGRTRDGRLLLLEAGSHTTNEYRYLPTDQPQGTFTLIAPRFDDEEYYPDHRFSQETGGIFYIRTNDTGRNFRLVTAPVASPGREQWTELLPLSPDAPLEDFDLFQTFLVTTHRKLGLPTLEVADFAPGNTLQPARLIDFPEPAYIAGTQINREFDTLHFRYSYTSLVSPASIYEYDLATDTSTLLKQQEVPGNFDRALYASERLWITAPDGVEVPVSLVYRRDRFTRDSSNPLYVYGYGSYGYPLPIGFSAARLSLLDRGVVLAYAHIRGGGELGDAWHDAGKMAVKGNTFTDFIAAVEQLIAKGYGDPTRVAIEGGSAGGLLLGAVVNQRPELFRAVLSHVPFVDVMNTMLDSTLPLTVAEYEEWGNPNEPEAFRTMLAYSPYENLDHLDAEAVPAMLVKTSLNDSQVMYWEPAKYIAKLRTLKRNPTPLLLHINMEAGHGGASGRYDYLKEIAFDYAFLLRQLSVES